MKCLIVHNEIFNWTNAMMVYVHAKLHMRKLDEAKPLRILKPRFHFWWCCNWSKGSCNIWLVMKTRKTQGIILNCLKQDGLSMQTEHGYNFGKTALTIRSSFEHAIILNGITINPSQFFISQAFFIVLKHLSYINCKLRQKWEYIIARF